MEALKLSPLFERSSIERQKKIGRRLSGCASVLETGFDREKDELKVKRFYFCHARICPVCSKRRSIEDAEEVMRAIARIKEDNSETHFLFVTLTVRNPSVVNLKSTMKLMSDAFHRLKQYPFFQEHVLGYLRKFELTLGAQGPDYCHPHYHCIIAVKPSYYKDARMGWAEIRRMWAKALRIDYEDKLQVDVQDLRQSDASKIEVFAASWERENPGKPIPDHYAFLAAAQELVKYEVKSSQIFEEVEEWMHANGSSENEQEAASAWILSVEDQISGSKEINSGGVFLEALKFVREEIVKEKKAIREGLSLEGLAWFRFDREEKRYVLSEHATHDRWIAICRKIQADRIISIVKASEKRVKNRLRSEARRKKKELSQVA
jgi:plasmid rolling circle replication initiator protein Rep